ncbi:MAG: aminotransferase class IV [Phycisphaerales bacterium]
MLVWINGRIVPAESATVSILDRGFLFGDGVYELVRYFNGVGVQVTDHIARLERSLRESAIVGFQGAQLATIGDELMRASGFRDGSVYLQVTRGTAATRQHIPPAKMTPTVVAFATALPSLRDFDRPEPVRAALVADPRWRRCDIKTISLMGNILALLAAQSSSGPPADEAILHRDGVVGEGTSTNVFAVVRGADGGEALVTPPLDSDPPILHGVTRLLAFAASDDLGLRVEQRRLAVDELLGAREVMVTSSRRIVAPVTHIDHRPVGDGGPGRTCLALFAAARRRLARECGVALSDGSTGEESSDRAVRHANPRAGGDTPTAGSRVAAAPAAGAAGASRP